MSGFWRRPPTFLDFIFGALFYLIAWVIVNLLCRPLFGNQVVDKYMAGRRGDFFGSDGPKKMLLGLLYIGLILAGLLLLLWFIAENI